MARMTTTAQTLTALMSETAVSSQYDVAVVGACFVAVARFERPNFLSSAPRVDILLCMWLRTGWSRGCWLTVVSNVTGSLRIR